MTPDQQPRYENGVPPHDEWIQVKPGEWWYGGDGRTVNGCTYPPSEVVSFAANEDGAPYSEACFHLHSYSNGAMPGDPDIDDDVDYLHICDLDEHIKQMTKLRGAMMRARRNILERLHAGADPHHEPYDGRRDPREPGRDPGLLRAKHRPSDAR